MRFFSALLVSLVSAAAFGAIVENINVAGETYLYTVENGSVVARTCKGEPKSDLDPATCSKSRYDAVPLADFRTRALLWGTYEAQGVADDLTKSETLLAQKKVQREEVRKTLQGLAPGATERKDFEDRARDLDGQIAQLETKIAGEKAQLIGFESLFGPNGYLQSDLLHPLVKGKDTYVAIRPVVKHFFDVFRYDGSDPVTSARDAKADMIAYEAKGNHPICGYWNGGTDEAGYYRSVIHDEGLIRVWITLNQSADFATAQALCKGLGMQVPSAEHIAVWHSHFFHGDDDDTETFKATQSIEIFKKTALYQSMPDFGMNGLTVKMFWSQNRWYPRPADYDAVQISTTSSWFSSADRKGGGLYSDPYWQLPVLCEKQYPELPRDIAPNEIPGCVRYIGWP